MIHKQKTYTGFVTDSKQKPIHNANVWLPDFTVGVYTDKNGIFDLAAFNGLTDKTKVTFSHIGYQTKTITLGETVGKDVVLTQKVLEGSTVTYKKKNKWLFPVLATVMAVVFFAVGSSNKPKKITI